MEHVNVLLWLPRPVTPAGFHCDRWDRWGETGRRGGETGETVEGRQVRGDRWDGWRQTGGTGETGDVRPGEAVGRGQDPLAVDERASTEVSVAPVQAGLPRPRAPGRALTANDAAVERRATADWRDS